MLARSCIQVSIYYQCSCVNYIISYYGHRQWYTLFLFPVCKISMTIFREEIKCLFLGTAFCKFTPKLYFVICLNICCHNCCRYLPKVFERYSGAEGFMFLQDNMIINYWNLLLADKTKLWITDKVNFAIEALL